MGPPFLLDLVIPDAMTRLGRVTIVGPGRVGSAMSSSLQSAGVTVLGPLRRGEAVTGDVVLLAVPDREIAAASQTVPAASVVGHTAGALTLDVFGGRESFSVHPLMTVSDGRTSFHGASAAIAGTTTRALAIARDIATNLGMEPIEIPESERATYHAAASIAANFLVTLESMAAEVGAKAGIERRHLLPLARAALENWGEQGEAALTGPIVRGDHDTFQRQRAAVARISPDLLPLWDALAFATGRRVRGDR
jgi:predicted short-subunit dehydrogenase-like oxidoreductase (DUF2520 family)